MKIVNQHLNFDLEYLLIGLGMKYKLEELSEETLVLRGSPPTLVRIKDKTAYVVDPGFPKERGIGLKNLLEKLDVKDVSVLLTHSHNDHIQATLYLSPSHVYASPIEIPQICYAKIRNYISYGFIYTKGLSLLEGKNIEKCETFKPRKSYGGFIPVKLPGRTFGHYGILTEDNVLYVSDALFGDKLIDKVGIPYIEDHKAFLESLNKILELSRIVKIIVLGHGPKITDQESLRKIVYLNKERILEIRQEVLKYLLEKCMHVESIASELLAKYNVKITPTSLLLSIPLVKSIVSDLYNENVIKPIYSEGFLKWKAK